LQSERHKEPIEKETNMVYVTVYIANGGTPLSYGGQSFAGHMWITGPDGRFGFAPTRDGDFYGHARRP
jgi:hypothetical protein